MMGLEGVGYDFTPIIKPCNCKITNWAENIEGDVPKNSKKKQLISVSPGYLNCG
jgi:hypothetical protein